ncbi:MAG: hypothetical protein K2H09_02380 [Treponemataceae bacterium]|nr:hypothetical protein [Treponemataceae bacterium]
MNCSVCRGCGRTLQTEFLYCPWCGTAAKSGGAEYADAGMLQYEKRRNGRTEQYIETIRQKIEALEKELDVLVLSAEMHK